MLYSAANLTVESAGPAIVLSGVTVSANLAIVTTGGLTVQGGAVLAGTGSIQGPVLVQAGGQLSPGLSPGTLLIQGPLTLQAGSTTLFELGAAGSSDRIEVVGSVTLGGTASLTALPGFVPGTVFRLIDNDGSDPVSGTFAGLAEGALLTLGGREYRLTYRGGDGNDVVLGPATTFVFLPIGTQRHTGGW